MTEKQFLLLREIQSKSDFTQRELAAKIGLAVSSVNENLKKLRQKGFIQESGLTETGIAKLEEYRVDNAVIMAAGMSTRFAPLSYEIPKGLLKVKGEILIERQIRQLKEAGINKIIVVVGYMKEKFFYLEEKFGVELVVNTDYYRYNNISTLYKIRERLGNSYICSSDNYFLDNVFEKYVYTGYYSCVYQRGETAEWCVQTDNRGMINKVTVGGKDAYVMLGHAYFSRDFSLKFCHILEKNYNRFGETDLLWEKMYSEYITELKLKMKVYDADRIREFDTLDDVISFDKNFLNTVHSEVLDHITSVLKCRRDEISEFTVLKKGLTNQSVRFKVGSTRYVYRHPGEGTDKIINRKSEKFSQEQAFKMGLDDTYIYLDPNNGWKISLYVENTRDFDYKNDDELNKAMQLLRILHQSDIYSTWEYNYFFEAEKIFQEIKELPIAFTSDLLSLRDRIKRLYSFTEADCIPKCFCHIDSVEENFLTDGDKMYLIDWEYAGMADPASDLGTMLCCSDYNEDDIERILQTYFGRALKYDEERHYKAYIALASYCWYIWALYKESLGQHMGERLLKWYRYANKYSKIAEELYQNEQRLA